MPSFPNLSLFFTRFPEQQPTGIQLLRLIRRVVERLFGSGIIACMRKSDRTCPDCKAAFRRIELQSRKGMAREFRCPICNALLETGDGSTEIAYRLTVAPEKWFESARHLSTSLR